MQTHAVRDRVHDARPFAPPPLQPPQARQVDPDALRFRRRDGAAPDAAVAGARCSAARPPTAGSAVRLRNDAGGAAPSRSPTRSAFAPVATPADHDPDPATGAKQTPDGCPRRREIAIEDWTRPGTMRDTAPSRRRVHACRVLKEARAVTTPCARLPSCMDLWRGPCSHEAGGWQPPTAAASEFTAVARNQSQELRCWRRNQNQFRPPDSRGLGAPSTDGRVWPPFR